MTDVSALDVARRRRSPATMPGYHAGRPPRNKGMPVSGRPAHRRRDRGGDAQHRQQPAWVAVASDHRRALARRTARPRSARIDRARPRPAPRLAARATRQGRPSPRGRDRRLGLGTGAPVAYRPRRAPARAAVLHHRRAHPRQAMVRRIGAPRVPRSRRPGRCQAPLRATSAAPRARARGRAAEHHSALARAHQPRHDLHLPPRHRSRGDPRSGPCAACTDDVGHRRARALSPAPETRERPGAPAFPGRKRRPYARTGCARGSSIALA